MSFDDRPGMCLVTGATGFIGSRFCERVNLAGTQRIRAFVRSPKKAASLAGPKVEIVRGDLLDPVSISRALKGCDAVIHLAHGDLATTATRNLVEIVCRADVKRFIHISSMAVHGPTPGPEAAHESTAKIGRYNSEYCDSKAEQEEIVQKAIDRGALRGVILRPTIVFGPNGPFVNRVLEEARTGTVTVIDEGAGLCNAVFIDDVCEAIEAAMVCRAALGKAMFINADQAVSWREFTLTIANFIQPPPQLQNICSAEAQAWWATIPLTPQLRRGLLPRMVRRALRLVSPKPQPPAFPDSGRIMRETVRVEFSNKEAKRLLGWAPNDFATGAAEVRKWFDRCAFNGR